MAVPCSKRDSGSCRQEKKGEKRGLFISENRGTKWLRRRGACASSSKREEKRLIKLKEIRKFETGLGNRRNESFAT